MKSYGDHPEFEAAAAIVREESGEHRVKNVAVTVSKGSKAVNNSKNAR